MILDNGISEFELPEPTLGNTMDQEDNIVVKRTEDGELWSVILEERSLIILITEIRDTEIDSFLEWLDALGAGNVTVTTTEMGTFGGKLQLDARRLAGLRRAKDCAGNEVYALELKVTNA